MTTDNRTNEPRRLKSCVEAWPECSTGEYNPSCCRFPKSCSATVYSEEHVTEDDLEPPAALVAAQGAAQQAGLPEIQHLWNDGVTWCGAEVKPWYPETRDESRAVPVCTLCHSRTHHHYAEQVKMLEEKVTELVGRQAKAPALPSSGVDEDKLAEVIAHAGTNWEYEWAEHKAGNAPDPAPNADYIARAVAKWLKEQGGENRGDRQAG